MRSYLKNGISQLDLITTDPLLSSGAPIIPGTTFFNAANPFASAPIDMRGYRDLALHAVFTNATPGDTAQILLIPNDSSGNPIKYQQIIIPVSSIAGPIEINFASIPGDPQRAYFDQYSVGSGSFIDRVPFWAPWGFTLNLKQASGAANWVIQRLELSLRN